VCPAMPNINSKEGWGSSAHSWAEGGGVGGGLGKERGLDMRQGQGSSDGLGVTCYAPLCSAMLYSPPPGGGGGECSSSSSSSSSKGGWCAILWAR
jgi:hypothetical protein